MKKAVLRCTLGAVFGITITVIISIIISLCVGGGEFIFVVPELAEDCGSELNAVILQTLCSVLYGAMWAGASLIWEKESWSLLKQSLLHFALCSLGTFPAAYFTRWMEHSLSGILSYFGIFFATYLFIWISQYLSIRKRVKAMNKRLADAK